MRRAVVVEVVRSGWILDIGVPLDWLMTWVWAVKEREESRVTPALRSE